MFRCSLKIWTNRCGFYSRRIPLLMTSKRFSRICADKGEPCCENMRNPRHGWPARLPPDNPSFPIGCRLASQLHCGQVMSLGHAQWGLALWNMTFVTFEHCMCDFIKICLIFELHLVENKIWSSYLKINEGLANI